MRDSRETAAWRRTTKTYRISATQGRRNERKTLTAVHLLLNPAFLLPAVLLPAADAAANTDAASPAIANRGVQLAQAETDAPSSAEDIDIRFGRHPEFDRIVFEWSDPVEVDVFRSGGELTVTFDRRGQAALPQESAFAYRLDLLPQLVFATDMEDEGRRYRLMIDPEAVFSVHRFEGGRLIAIDIARPAPVEELPATGEEGGDIPPPAEAADGPSEEDAAPEADLDEDGDVEAYEDDAGEEGEDDVEDEEDEGYSFDVGGEFELFLGGTTQFGVATAGGDRLSDGDGDRGYTFFTDTDIDIAAYATFFEEVDVGAVITLEADADVSGDSANADETYIYLDHPFGEMQLGRTSGAEDDMALGADTIARGTGGIDGDTANLGDTQVETSGDAAKITYFTPREEDGFQFGVSFTPDTGDDETDDDDGFDLEHHVGVGLNLVKSFGDRRLSLATVGSFGESEFSSADDLRALSVGGTLLYPPFELGASYGHVEEDDDFDFATAGINVLLDGLGLEDAGAGFGYNLVDAKSDGVTHIFVLSGDAPLFPGVALQGDISIADPESGDGNVASVLAIEFDY